MKVVATSNAEARWGGTKKAPDPFHEGAQKDQKRIPIDVKNTRMERGDKSVITRSWFEKKQIRGR